MQTVVCVRKCRPKVNVRCLPQSFSSLFFDSESLSEPRTHQLTMPGSQQVLGSHCVCLPGSRVTGVFHSAWLLKSYLNVAAGDPS